jgi:trimethylamine---corrinoid protein Co-methyltransferase
MKTGPMGGLLSILSEDAIQRVHEAALALLQDPGIQSESDLFLDIFARGGATVDREERTIRIPPDMVEAALATAPSSFTLHARRDPQNDLLIEPNRVYYGMGGTSEPMIWDWGKWAPRQPAKQDMVRSTRLGHALSNIDFVQTLCMSGDQPTGQIFFHDFDAIFRNTTKPTVLNILERPFTELMLGLAAAASGGEEELRAKPSMLGIVTPVSPLKIAIMNEGIVDAVNAGVPILYSPGPMMGATGPATVAGTLALTTAEVLFGVVLTQLIKPGAKVVLKPDTDVFDMRTNQCTYSSPEQNLGKLAMAQLAKRYGVPIYSLGGGVEAKVPDADAASEAMMSMLLNALAGINLNQSLGSMAFGLYGCQEQVVMCDEFVRMIKRILQGIAVDDDTLAVDAIREAGYGGSFLGMDHTVRHFRKELYFPLLFKRQTIEQWTEAGSRMAHDVAHDKVEEILAKAGPVPLPPSVDVALEQALEHAIRETSALAVGA